MQTAEQAYLAARKEARSGADSAEQPAPVEAVDVLEDSAPIEEVETEEVTHEESTAEIEESTKAEEATAETSEMDDLFADYNGREINLREASEWEESHKNIKSMQADCTRKWQEASELKKSAEEMQSSNTSKQAKLSEQLATLEAMISEDSLTDEQLNDLWDDDPDEWKALTEKQKRRKEFLKEAKKTAKPVSSVNAQEEQAKLIKANPQWLNEGKATEAYQSDMTALSDYYADNGFTQEQVDQVNSSSLLAQAVIDAARFKATNVKKAVVEKRVRKAPVSTKPKAQASNTVTTEIKKLQAEVKRTGDPKLFQKLRQLQRKQGN